MADPLPWSEALFHALARHSGDIISLLDAEGRLLYNSPAAERISGFSAEELAGADTFALMHPDDRAAVAEAFRRVLAGPGATVTVQYRYRTRGGGWTWMEAVATNRLDDPEVRGVVASSRDVTERKRAEDALRQGEERLRALAARVEAVREEEQARIARDLHDDLAQLLAGLGLELRRLENRLRDPGAPAWLEDWLVGASALLGQAHASVRRISLGIRPATLDALGLPQALALEARRFEERTGVPCAVQVEPLPPLPPATATALYRITQEALTNVARHAGATAAAVHLRVPGAALVLVIEDDGRGPGGAAGGLGLLGMQERAAQAGGTVVLERREPRGARVVARLPIPPRAAAAG